MRLLILMCLAVATATLLGRIDSYCSVCDMERPVKDEASLISMHSIPKPSAHSIYFTEAGTPVSLISSDDKRQDMIAVNFQSVYDSSGAIVDTLGFDVVSVFKLRSTPLTTHYSNTPKVPRLVKAITKPSPTNIKPVSKLKRSANLPELTRLESHTFKPDKTVAQVNRVTAIKPRRKLASYNLAFDSANKRSEVNYLRHASFKFQPDIVFERSEMNQDFSVPSLPTYSSLNVGTQQLKRSVVLSQKVVAAGVGNRAKAKRAFTKSKRFKIFTETSTTDDESDVEDDIDDLNDRVDDLATDLEDTQESLTGVQEGLGILQTQVGDVDIIDLSARFGDLSAQLNGFEDKTYAGIASTSALVTAIPSEPGMTVINLGYGHYEGQNALGLSVSKRMSTINGYYYGGVATGISEVKTPLIRAGVGIEF